MGIFTAEKSMWEAGQQRFELLSNSNAIMDLQVISQDESCGLMEQQLLKIGCHGHLCISGLGQRS